MKEEKKISSFQQKMKMPPKKLKLQRQKLKKLKIQRQKQKKRMSSKVSKNPKNP